ncbi:MAG: SPASM domain-containing protein, partial [Candidatus Korarchaeota archaeon]|nr:SPASM domain-containing protein [Candidatus Korarchaeota archaeon]NIU82377.1 SPASM domain-containing protein [Candidatus Thorarchaeota archaeon]NIW12844.1 SPASM domain-containing protein [Candidatus Thorarchaeota archaeon]NIW51045.1 SPASM domain-containing protein [Candidatus Korarchaeota archaeon]
MRDDWVSVAQCIKDLGMNLTFVSNGILLPEVLEDLAELDPKVVGISLDGMKKKHNYIRGEETFRKAIKAINLLRNHDIQTTVITTISKINFKDLLRMKDLILKRGINWQIQVATPFGNFTKDLMISKEEFYATALWIAKERINQRFEELPVIGAHDFGYYSDILPTSEWDGCPAGKTSLGITSNGGIVGCLAMGNERFIEGNVRDQSLVAIWEDPKSFSYNRHFERADLGPNCKDCKHSLKCIGGCNSMSYALTEQFHNDPYCFHLLEK